MGLYLNGLRFESPLADVLDGLVTLRPLAHDLMDAKIAGTLARMAVEGIDAFFALGEGQAASKPMGTAWNEISERHERSRVERRRDPAVDVDLELVLFPRGGATVALLRTEESAWGNIFTALGAVDWSWGHYERPKGVDEATWARRANDWTAAMGGDAHWTPSVRGVTYSYTQPFVPNPKPARVLGAVPNRDARVTPIARRALATAFLHRHGGTPDVSAIIGAMHDEEALAAERVRLLPLLPDITMDLLLQGPGAQETP